MGTVPQTFLERACGSTYIDERKALKRDDLTAQHKIAHGDVRSRERVRYHGLRDDVSATNQSDYLGPMLLHSPIQKAVARIVLGDRLSAVGKQVACAQEHQREGDGEGELPQQNRV